jgi:hypothetical protein
MHSREHGRAPFGNAREQRCASVARLQAATTKQLNFPEEKIVQIRAGLLKEIARIQPHTCGLEIQELQIIFMRGKEPKGKFFRNSRITM